MNDRVLRRGPAALAALVEEEARQHAASAYRCDDNHDDDPRRKSRRNTVGSADTRVPRITGAVTATLAVDAAGTVVRFRSRAVAAVASADILAPPGYTVRQVPIGRGVT